MVFLKKWDLMFNQKRENMSTKIKLISLYIVSSILFIISLQWHPYQGSFVLKAIPALSMALLLFLDGRPYFRLMSLGFVFSALGDIALDLDRVKYFIFGLGFFLIAHLFYIFTFWKVTKIKNIYYLKIGLVIIFSLLMGIVLWPTLGSLKIPVMIYLLVISTMTITASMRDECNLIAYLGAWIFMSSDAMIAVNKFLIPFPHAGLAIIITYYVGNFMLGMSLLKKE
jgi:alkenylglycerophosphocholine/alkenylglycerophosphoethanolamine hydrolase